MPEAFATHRAKAGALDVGNGGHCVLHPQLRVSSEGSEVLDGAQR